jgi:hypothetical protein
VVSPPHNHELRHYSLAREVGASGARWARGRSPAGNAPAATLIALLVAGGCFTNPCGDEAAKAARTQQAELVETAPPLGDQPDIGLETLRDWAALPHLRDTRYEQFSSYSRGPGTALQPGGEDFNNFIAHAGSGPPLLLEHVDGPDPDGRRNDGYLLAAVDDGPGYVSRMFFTRFSVADLFRGLGFFRSGDLGRFAGEVLRIYVDDLEQPAFVIPLADMGAADPFARPFAGYGGSAVTSYVPISFAQSLRMRLDGLCPLCGYFYHVDVQRTAEPTRPFSPRLADDPAYAAAADLLAQFGEDPRPGAARIVDDEPFALPAGEWTDILDYERSGTITRLRFVVAPARQPALSDLRLRIEFEDAAEPAADVPLDAFFGCREEMAPFRTLAMRVDCDDGNLDAACFLPMPFRQRAWLRLRNEGETAATVRASVRVDPALPDEPWGYLHARLSAVDGPQPAGSQFEVLDVAGRGRFVGTFLFAAGRGDPRLGALRAALNILEGNDTGIIDGEVRLHGTGTEDYYNGGFYFAEGPFDHPFSAVNLVQGGFAESGTVSCCRWHVLGDAIDFQRSFTLRFQYASDNPALVVRYATVAYYYLNSP